MRLRDEPFDPTTTINYKKGDPITDDDGIKHRWEEYFSELLNPTSQSNTNVKFQPSRPEEEEPSILVSEVRQVLRTSPRNKAAGADGIITEAILACGETGITWLTAIFQKAWREINVPEDWQRAVIIPIWKKKGNKRDSNTYRGISLLSHVGKMYAKILEQRARHKADPLLSETQMGFMKGRGCTDAIFTLRQLSEKTIEYNKELNIIFVDQEKAFDRIKREIMWKVLEQYNIRGQLLDNIRALYANCESALRTQKGLSNWFKVTSGVRQGCVLSPLLFIIYMDMIAKEANPDPEALNELLFADDQSIFHEDEGQLQEHTPNLNAACENYGMKISLSKTETMKVSREPGDLNININNTGLKQVK